MPPMARLLPISVAPSPPVVRPPRNCVGSITTATAAATIGSALTPYAAGADVLFAVDNGTQTGVFRFVSSGADAVVSAAELTQVALLNGSTGTALVDYTFAP